MISKPRIFVIIPAFNEEGSIGKVVEHIPKGLVEEVIVVNNNSTDNTVKVARNAGATVLSQPKMGYGNACLKGIEYAKNKEIQPEIIVFLDGDFSDYPEEIPLVIEPILERNIDLVIGSRALGNKEKGSMTPQQVFGNWLATTLMHWFYKVKFTDLGPFRAIKFDKLLAIEMEDKTYGWTVEMQLKAVKNGLKCEEVPVNYKRRIGVSKVSGTVKGTIMAGYKILWTIFKYL
ncbi:MAG: glycosyltransferase involved in cell wall biosynthesis [Flammeovirgaceae bacterium]|jgi:glycosyltransferase involved in cell wall biosynthesis